MTLVQLVTVLFIFWSWCQWVNFQFIFLLIKVFPYEAKTKWSCTMDKFTKNPTGIFRFFYVTAFCVYYTGLVRSPSWGLITSLISPGLMRDHGADWICLRRWQLFLYDLYTIILTLTSIDDLILPMPTNYRFCSIVTSQISCLI